MAEQLAAQTNAQLAIAAPTPLSFEPLGIAQLRERWLHYHEHVRRSSVATVQRYRTASAHLIDFVRKQPRLRLASHFNAVQAEAFAAYLRQLRVAPNGHAHTAKRPLRAKSVKFILEVCRSLFSYAARRPLWVRSARRSLSSMIRTRMYRLPEVAVHYRPDNKPMKC